jgi:hypothetical protein
MRDCPLTQSLVPVLACALLAVACGKDPILEAVDAMEEGSPRTGTPMPGVDGQPEKGIPEEPEPGIPTEPSAGGESAGAAGLSGEPAKGVPEEPEPGVPEQPAPAPSGSTERPTPPPSVDGQGAPEEPEPGVPEDPEPAPPGSPGGAAHAGKEDGGVEEGPHALIRGRIDSGGGSGKIRIDMFDGDQRNVSGPRPKVVGVHEIDSPGGFEVSVPQAHKRVWIGAYRDLNGNNRPDKGEPSGWYSRNPVYLDSIPSSVIITLVVEGKATGLGLDFGE